MAQNHTQEPTVSSSAFSDTATIISSPIGSSLGQGLLFPRTIPEKHDYRTLVLCFDGTGDQFDSDNSNIVEFFTMLKKDDSDQQMVYYQAGIGTYTSPQVATPLAAKISKTMDEAIAWNLDAHVMGGYEFLMQNYKAGDRICIFGFSRGAYTARGLAGMLHKVGLLPACNFQQVPFAYKMFTRVDDIGWQQSNAFKKAFSVDVPIEFIGVWDTVNSVGLIPRRLPFTTSNTIVKTFRHAVSLDERRAKFKANLWNRPNDAEAALGVEGQKPEVPAPLGQGITSPGIGLGGVVISGLPDGGNGKDKADGVGSNAISGLPSSGNGGGSILKGENAKKGKQGQGQAKKGSMREMEKKYSEMSNKPTDIEEVWFSGCHCDVGGGSVANDVEHTLARIPLRWMIRECFKTDTGIMFKSAGLQRVGIDPNSLYPSVKPRPPPLPTAGTYVQHIPSSKSPSSKPHFADVNDLIKPLKTEEEHELLDAMAPIYDQLSLAWGWWLLELLPIKQRYQKGDNKWQTEMGMNLGRGRFIPKQKKCVINVHRSVKMRMDAEYPDGSKYVPKASFENAVKCKNIKWVD